MRVMRQLGDHDFCLSRSHYTDTDPTSRERAATAGIWSSSPGDALFGLSYRAPQAHVVETLKATKTKRGVEEHDGQLFKARQFMVIIEAKKKQNK